MAEVLVKQDTDSVKPFITITGNEEKRDKPRVTIWMTVAVVATLLGSCLPGGYCLGVINTPQEIIRLWVKRVVLERHHKELSPTEEVSLWALVVSIFVGGAIVGALFGTKLADRVGRRAGLLVNHWMCVCSSLLLIWCKMLSSVEMLIIGRFISGLCTGIGTCLVPLYLSEVAPAELRGIMGVTFPLGMCSGVLLSQLLGMESVLGTECSWPYLMGGYIVFVGVALVLHPALPESPTYCYTISRDQTRGRRELYRLRGSDKQVEAEESSLKMLGNAGSGPQERSWTLARVIKFRRHRLSLLIAVLFNVGQQFSGINAVFYYSTLIFRSAGLDIHQSQGAAVGAGVINCVMAILAVPLIKYCRRRVLLLTSVALCCLCQVVLMVALRLTPTSSHAPYVAIVALMLYVLVYGMGLGPIPYMIATELFPVGPRSVGISLGGTSNWLSNLIVGLTFPLVQDTLGELSFTVFITSCCLLFVFIYWFLPETFGEEEMPLDRLSEKEQESDEGTSTSSITEGTSVSV